MFKAVRAYTKSLAEVARWRLGYTFALVVISSLTEGLGLALLLPTLQLAGVDIGSGSAAGRYAALVREGFGAVGLRPSLALMLAIFVAIICMRAMLTRAQGMAITVLYETFAQHLRQRLFEAVSGANWLFICKSRSSDFVHALTNEVDRASGAAYQGLNTVSGAAVAALYIAASFILFPTATLLMLGLCAVLALLLRAKTRAVYSAGGEMSDVTNSVYSAAIEHFQSIKTAKMYGAQRRTCDIFSGLTRDMTVNRPQVDQRATLRRRMVRDRIGRDDGCDASGGDQVDCDFARRSPDSARPVRPGHAPYQDAADHLPRFRQPTAGVRHCYTYRRAMPGRGRTGRRHRTAVGVSFRLALRKCLIQLPVWAGSGSSRHRSHDSCRPDCSDRWTFGRRKEHDR